MKHYASFFLPFLLVTARQAGQYQGCYSRHSMKGAVYEADKL